MKPDDLTREALFALVWDRPMVEVAKELGVSDVGLKKICVRHKIPTPPRGYWQALRAGKPMPKASLPPLETRAGEARIAFSVKVKDTRDCDPEQLELAEELISRLEAVSWKKSGHPDTVLTDPRVKTSAIRLRNAKRDERGLIRSSAKSCLDIRVTNANVDRALRLMDELAFMLDATGCELDINDDGATVVCILGEKIPIYLEEQLDRSQRDLTQPQLRELERHPWRRFAPEYDYSPTGRLGFHIADPKLYGIRRSWRDTSRRILDGRLDRVVRGLLDAAIAIRTDRRRSERRERERHEDARRAEERRQRQALEDARIKRLDEQMELARRAKLVREFAEDLESSFGSDEARAGAPYVEEWTNWVRRYADRLTVAWRNLAAETDPSEPFPKPWWSMD